MNFPKTRGECRDGPRPCPWVRCRHHLAVNKHAYGKNTHHSCRKQDGGVKLENKWLDNEAAWDGESCSLDIADGGRSTLQEVADLLGITREAVRQAEERALRSMSREVKRAGLWHLAEGTMESRDEPVYPKPLGDFEGGWREFRNKIDIHTREAIKSGKMAQPLYNPAPRDGWEEEGTR